MHVFNTEVEGQKMRRCGLKSSYYWSCVLTSNSCALWLHAGSHIHNVNVAGFAILVKLYFYMQSNNIQCEC